jgi:hypothetical protein
MSAASSHRGSSLIPYHDEKLSRETGVDMLIDLLGVDLEEA